MASLTRSTSAPPQSLAPDPDPGHKVNPPSRRHHDKVTRSSGEQGTVSAESPSQSELREKQHIRAEDVNRVQSMIERCMQLYMPLTDIVSTLQSQARIEPQFTKLVWQKLEEQNSGFFEAYHMKLRLKTQIVSFNQLLDQQCSMMQKLHADWMQAQAYPPFSAGPAGVGPFPLPLVGMPPGVPTAGAPQPHSFQQSQPFPQPHVPLEYNPVHSERGQAGQPSTTQEHPANQPELLSSAAQGTMQNLLLPPRISNGPPTQLQASAGLVNSKGPADDEEDALDLLTNRPAGLTAQDDLMDLMPGWAQSDSALQGAHDLFMSAMKEWHDSDGLDDSAGAGPGPGNRHSELQREPPHSPLSGLGAQDMQGQCLGVSSVADDALHVAEPGQHAFSIPGSPQLATW